MFNVEGISLKALFTTSDFMVMQITRSMTQLPVRLSLTSEIRDGQVLFLKKY